MTEGTHAGRDGRGRYRRSPEVAKRNAACAKLYAQGYSYRDIAEKLNISVSMAHRGVQAVFRDTASPAAEELRRASDEQLAELEAELWQVVETERYVVSAGRVTEIEDDSQKLQALAQLKAIIESRRKMYGVDQPSKVTVDGGVRYEVVGVDLDKLT